jgi:segregation and condensation protein B
VSETANNLENTAEDDVAGITLDSESIENSDEMNPSDSSAEDVVEAQDEVQDGSDAFAEDSEEYIAPIAPADDDDSENIVDVQEEDSQEDEEVPDEEAGTDDDNRDLRTIIESLIFASDEPLGFKSIKEILEGGSVTKSVRIDEDESTDTDTTAPRPRKRRSSKSTLTVGKVRKWVEDINEEYESQLRPFRIIEVSGGFAYQTISEYGQYVGRLYAERSKRRLTQSALETLAIVAYKQPISKPGVEAIRGVNADYVIKSLLEKGLLAIVGREDTVGRPLLYGTTNQFLKHFGLHSLNDLPKPREIEELLKESEEELSPPIEVIEEADDFHQHDFTVPSIFDDVPRFHGPLEQPIDGPGDDVIVNDENETTDNDMNASDGSGISENPEQIVEQNDDSASPDDEAVAMTDGESESLETGSEIAGEGEDQADDTNEQD